LVFPYDASNRRLAEGVDMHLRTQARLAAAAIALFGLAPSAEGLQRAGSTQVRLDSGWIRGEARDGTVAFSGIPYAAAPTGDRRFAPPAVPRPWTGVRDATRPSPACPQPEGFGEEGIQVAGQEDCLYLNVVVPRTASRRPLPVLVWFHGGGLITGSASQYDGTRLAGRGDVIVITANYRLGALGFLSAPALDAEGSTSGNYGLLDQNAVLRWVRRNADALGGDPRKVTVAGQSAGSQSICAHLASPAARGLFQRAILQSGPCANRVFTKAEADRKGSQAIAEAGCSTAGDTAGCLRDLPVKELVALMPDFGVPAARREARWGPVAGTSYLPHQPITALRHGSAAGTPLLMGTTHDESRSFVLGSYPGLTPDAYAAEIRAIFADADTVLAEYPADHYPSPAIALATVLTDQTYACPQLTTARTASAAAPVFAYEFQENSGLTQAWQPMGAMHGWDLPFLWKLNMPQANYPELTLAQRHLSDTMIGYWATFAHKGTPNATGLARWRPFTHRSTVLTLSATSTTPTDFADDHHCTFWAARPSPDRAQSLMGYRPRPRS
jgi:para-nitrobenzyl esterase